jgi:hypothetical protein
VTALARAGLLAAALSAAAPLAAAPLVVDSFDDAEPENDLGGSSSVWGDETDPSVSCVATLDAAAKRGDAGRALRLDYDLVSDRQTVFVPTNYSVSNPAQVRDEVYNGYYSVFNPVDLSAYKSVSFWARGDAKRGFTRSFRFELKDGNSSGGVTVSGLTDKWQKFSFPLAVFKELRDWTAVKEYAVVFGPTYVTRREGAVYIDDVAFEKPEDPKKAAAPARVYQAARATPEVDGRLDEWPESAFTDLSGLIESGAVSRRQDLSAWFAVAWDERRLYIAADVQDDQIANARTGQDLWKDDVVEVYIDPTDDKFLWGDAAHFQLGFAPTSAGGAPARWAWFQRREPTADEIVSEVKVYRDGYHLEAGIAWSFLGVSRPEPDRGIGFSLAVHDRDDRDASPEAKLNWSFVQTDGLIHLGRVVLR